MLRRLLVGSRNHALTTLTSGFVALFGFFVAPVAANGNVSCIDIYQKRAPLFDHQLSPPPKFSESDFLSAEQIQSIMSQYPRGRFRTVTARGLRDDPRYGKVETLKFQLSFQRSPGDSLPQNLIEVVLIKMAPDTVAVAWLNIRTMDSKTQGMPLSTFKGMQDMLIKLAKQDGYTNLIASSPINYMVSTLYRRSGFQPFTEEAVQFYETFDLRYRQARKSLPEDLRAANAEDFMAMISFGEKLSPVTFAEFAKTATPISDNGSVFALVGQIDRVTKVILVQPKESNDRPFQPLRWELLPHVYGHNLKLQI